MINMVVTARVALLARPLCSASQPKNKPPQELADVDHADEDTDLSGGHAPQLDEHGQNES